ncbi:MAG TPA: hypothetical protein VF518_13815 [Polyangia bacterium]
MAPRATHCPSAGKYLLPFPPEKSVEAPTRLAMIHYDAWMV